MNRADREAAVHRIMAQTPPPVPPDLHAEAVRHGERLLRRRRLARRTGWLLLLAAAVAFTVWALAVEPWAEPPSRTTPPPLTDR
ncbi:hypothetical protein [Streptomyces sp. NPDC006610]|jgi:ferric-dicitrate binding protein FerR (iron transport regulator)|uniref:hypothetical protein n=1 Tax=Streptomyces sp. NPDC006610 TaxID=3154584 RepID=UPI0033A15854